MGELFEQFKVELKNVAKFLHIEEVKEEHHSIPSAPHGTPKERLGRKTVWGKVNPPAQRSPSYYEGNYLADRFKPVRPIKGRDWRRSVNARRT